MINLRLSQADESVAAARLLVERGMRLGAMDRIYFTMFYCACAMLATKQRDLQRMLENIRHQITHVAPATPVLPNPRPQLSNHG